jgi:hypothetical protein
MTQEELKDKINQVFDDLDMCLNYDDKEVAEIFKLKLARTHRTLQQNFWRTIHAIALHYKDMGYDLRNEDSIKFCKMIAELGDIYFAFV